MAAEGEERGLDRTIDRFNPGVCAAREARLMEVERKLDRVEAGGEEMRVAITRLTVSVERIAELHERDREDTRAEAKENRDLAREALRAAQVLGAHMKGEVAATMSVRNWMALAIAVAGLAISATVALTSGGGG